ncbi:MAG: flagellar hook basal-body protein [Proteobacteria bacterium]|nr:flagellar hook basal-body protein [Pseudomonadota bacterium]
MNGAFYIGATSLQAQQRGLEVIANNVANMNTVGFKRSHAVFAELAGEADPIGQAGFAPLAGVQVSSASRVFDQGQLRETGQRLDLAISGDGFIEVLGRQGELVLWRGGALRIGAEGQLETTEGLQLKSAVTVPEGARDIVIDRGGQVSAKLGEETIPLGQIELVSAPDAEQLRPVGGGYYAIPDQADPAPVDLAESGAAFVQGSVEGSNVELTSEMVSLLLMQRAYSASAQVIQAGDQLMSIANNLRR